MGTLEKFELVAVASKSCATKTQRNSLLAVSFVAVNTHPNTEGREKLREKFPSRKHDPKPTFTSGRERPADAQVLPQQNAECSSMENQVFAIIMPSAESGSKNNPLWLVGVLIQHLMTSGVPGNFPGNLVFSSPCG